MSITRFPHGISSFGIPLLGGQGLTMPGKAIFVDAVNGVDTGTGEDIGAPFKTISYARGFLTTKKNDTLYMIQSSTDFTMSSAHTWDKDYTHVVGLAPPTYGAGKGCSLGNLASGTPKVTISGSGCIFSNFQSKHGGAGSSTGNYINFSVTGNANYFWNVGLIGPLDSSTAVSAYRELNVGACADNTFERCTFGNQTTIDASSTVGYEVNLAGITGTTVFKDSLFTCYASSAGHVMVGASANFGAESVILLFDRCFFVNMDADVTLTKIIDTPAAANGMVFINYCAANLATDWADKTANVFVIGPAAAETGGIGTPPA